SFLTEPATTHISTLSLHDALPILLESMESARARGARLYGEVVGYGSAGAGTSNALGPHARGFSGALTAALADAGVGAPDAVFTQDRKSTRLNSSHGSISYAVFCLK